MAHQDPNSPDHRPFLLPGEVSEEGQERRQEAAKYESGPLYGDHPRYPDRATPESPEMARQDMERQEYLRACHGGVPDAPEAVPQPPTQHASLKG